ncbi:CBO0543 family protein [Virgibacillus sp. CBA3643]|uniref:CBO0543 family protein n=1 Tax=Virgibacillus sp. CBA3643 TaxID=2942278 RepID=UPI0035A363A2
MKEKQLELLNKAVTEQEEASQILLEYWKLYSNMGSWQFWVILIFLLALPLIVLYFTIDRKKIFLIGFYGFSVNVWFTLAASIGTRLGWWDYPYMLFPFTQTGFSIISSVVPVLFMLVYQWTLNHNKNFYIFSLLISLFFSFVFVPLLVSFNLFRLNDGFNYFHVLLIFISVFVVSKLIINVFLYMQQKELKVKGSSLHIFNNLQR